MLRGCGVVGISKHERREHWKKDGETHIVAVSGLVLEVPELHILVGAPANKPGVVGTKVDGPYGC